MISSNFAPVNEDQKKKGQYWPNGTGVGYSVQRSAEFEELVDEDQKKNGQYWPNGTGVGCSVM